MPRRDKLDILKEILVQCRGEGMKKTKLAYASNLNFQKASQFLEWMCAHNLVREEEKGIFVTTSDGEAMLANLEKTE